ncbi:MAG: trypsin-like peptidase domain-containing protein [Jannaschia sp.]
MTLESRSKPVSETASLPPETSARIVSTPAKLIGEPDQRGLVHGKSKVPIRIGTGVLSVIGADERRRIRQTELNPYRMICALQIDAPWGEFVGTGWLAGPQTLITAGHCLFDRQQMGGWAHSIEITPGRDGDEPPAFGCHTATRFSSVDKWLDSRDPDFDIGAIHLDAPLGDELGWFGIRALPDAEIEDRLVNVSGYPASPGRGTQQMWAMNRIRAVTPRRIFYDVDTSGGQSGGPVYYIDAPGSAPEVIGIHAYGIGGTPGDIQLEVNSAPRIIPEVVEQIQAWVQADTVGVTASP